MTASLNVLRNICTIFYITLTMAYSSIRAATPSQPAEPHSFTVCHKFATLQQEKLNKFSDFLKVSPPPAYTNMLSLLAQPGVDPIKLQREFELVMKPAEKVSDPRIAAMRHIVHEAFGASAIVRQWPSQLMELFVRDILFELPENCIYLCSSDEGRFAIQAYRDALEKRGVYIVSYNRLNDASYISYLRWQHGDAIKLPQRDDISRAMQSYIKEAREGETPFSGVNHRQPIMRGNLES